MLELDAVLFEQVLFNLLDNAAKYAPADTTISIRSVREKDSVVLQILDEGGGIPPAELESVFDKFYRAQKGDHVRPGTGLGLAISRGFVEAMHGTISAANRSDRSGAVLTIRLPVPADAKAFSSEVDTASREENASKQKTRASVLTQSEPRL
jgi:two-component system, OmpR family, sensor histidine kinase KdpD